MKSQKGWLCYGNDDHWSIRGAALAACRTGSARRCRLPLHSHRQGAEEIHQQQGRARGKARDVRLPR